MHSNVALVVDDEPVVLQLLCRLMKGAGFTPMPGDNGQHALQLLGQNGGQPPALVLTDINMPVMDGVELVRELRNRWPLLPAVFVTGNPGWAPEASPFGEVLLKPFHHGALLAATRRAVLSATLENLLSATGAPMGNIQVVNRAGNALVIEAQRGFQDPFLKFFQSTDGGSAACGSALQARQRIVVEDVRTSPVFCEASRQAMLEASAFAVQSTPIVREDGSVLGVLSTHYSAPHRFDSDELRPVDEIAQRTATLLERLGP